MKNVYEDFHFLKQYVEEDIELVMTDMESLIYPKSIKYEILILWHLVDITLSKRLSLVMVTSGF